MSEAEEDADTAEQRVQALVTAGDGLARIADEVVSYHPWASTQTDAIAALKAWEEARGE